MKFEFTPANMKIAQEIISRYPSQYKKAAVIPLLELGQIQNKNWTSLAVMDYISYVARGRGDGNTMLTAVSILGSCWRCLR